MEFVASISLMLLLIATGVTAAAACVWLAVRVSRFHESRRQAGAAYAYLGCGRCGYRVEGWSTTACPECGADRDDVAPREVWVVSWRDQARLAVSAGLIVLSLVVVVAVVKALG